MYVQGLEQSFFPVIFGVRSLRAKTQLYPFGRFDRTPTCDRQSDRHRMTANRPTVLARRRVGKSHVSASGQSNGRVQISTPNAA